MREGQHPLVFQLSEKKKGSKLLLQRRSAAPLACLTAACATQEHCRRASKHAFPQLQQPDQQQQPQQQQQGLINIGLLLQPLLPKQSTSHKQPMLTLIKQTQNHQQHQQQEHQQQMASSITQSSLAAAGAGGGGTSKLQLQQQQHLQQQQNQQQQQKQQRCEPEDGDSTRQAASTSGGWLFNIGQTKLLVAGAASAVVSRTLMAPLERVKMDLLLKTSTRSALDTALWVWQREGLAGFWKGNGLNLLRTAPFKVGSMWGCMWVWVCRGVDGAWTKPGWHRLAAGGCWCVGMGWLKTDGR